MSYTKVSRILRDTQSRSLVVIDAHDRPSGFLSIVDINNRVVAEELDPKKVKAKDVMTKEILILDENENVEKAIEMMTKKNFLSCPITRKNKLIGICSLKDVVHYIQKKKLTELDKK